MKVISADEMVRVERLAYDKGAKDADFMEEAGRSVAAVIQKLVHQRGLAKVITLLCGKGNNAGDAYVVGRVLQGWGFAVTACQLVAIEECSPLCKDNHYRFLGAGGYVREVQTVVDLRLPHNGVLVDGIFGTGFKGTVPPLLATAIEAANDSKLPIVAIDMPSGLDGTTGVAGGVAIEAAVTVFLGRPKTGYFLDGGWNHVGELQGVDFGMDEAFFAQAKEDLVLLTPDLVKPLMPTIRRSRHKYEAGLVLGLAGSPGMPGAALLASLGAFRGGAGLVKLLHPEPMANELVAAPYELIRVPYHKAEDVVDAIAPAKAVFVGPGLGRQKDIEALLNEVLPHIACPCVLDADALYHVAEANLRVPRGAILTPHVGEMHRLLGLSQKTTVTLDFLAQCQRYTEDRKVTLVLKGAPTFIFEPGETPLVCGRGDPGMATAGSGDVLTGLIAALLAQGVLRRDAAALGVYLHAVAGEAAAETRGSYSMMASDILEHLPEAFLWKRLA